MTKKEQLKSKPKTPRARKCLSCREWFKPKEQGVTTCSEDCAINHGRTSWSKQVKKEKRKAKTELNRNDKKWLKNNARYWCHKYIRLRDANKPCISCGCTYNSLNKIQAGHFKNDGNHAYIRYNEWNINGQCVRCNMHKGGEEKPYEEELRRRIGDEKVDYLLSVAHQVKSYTEDDLRGIIKHYKNKVKELEAEQ